MPIPEKLGAYRVIRPLGKGGMGAVYEVIHEQLGVHYALKFFISKDTNSEFLQKRFVAEGRILARLRHPNLVCVHNLEFDADTGIPYFVMDMVTSPDGTSHSLAEVMAKGCVSEDRIARWYEDMRSALAAVHAAGIVHRDIKLDNILLNAEDHAVLSDFGVSRVVNEELRTDLSLTSTFVTGESAEVSRVLGTVMYLAPELKTGSVPTPASDYYALGMVFFRLLTGMWYTPSSRALDLLEPFEYSWREVLEALLAPDPEVRTPRALVLTRHPVSRVRKVALMLLASVAAVGAVAWAWRAKGVSSPPRDAQEVQVAPKVEAVSTDKLTVLSFDLGDGVAPLEFVPVAPGVFSRPVEWDEDDRRMGGRPRITVAQSRITYPYWIARRPLTVAQMRKLEISAKQLGHVFAEARTKVPQEIQDTWAGAVFFKNRMGMDGQCQACKRLFGQEIPKGYVFRLPSDGEWYRAFELGNPNWIAQGCISSEMLPPTNVIAELRVKYGLKKAELAMVLPTSVPDALGLYGMGGYLGDCLLDLFDEDRLKTRAGDKKGELKIVDGLVDYPARDPFFYSARSSARSLNSVRTSMISQRFNRTYVHLRQDDPMAMVGACGLRLVIGPDLQARLAARD